MKRVADADAAAAADTVLRLAVLLQAGVAPTRAWVHLAESGDPAAIRVRTAFESGLPATEAIAQAAPPGARRSPQSASHLRAWQDVAAAWTVATTVGAPLAESLRGLASALRDAQEAADEVRVALAEPAGTARLMAWLPLVAVGLGMALGFDPVGTLAGGPLGIACLVGGGLLVLAARSWSGALARRAQAGAGIPGLDAELLAIGLSGGVSIDRARLAVEAATGSSAGPETDAVLALSHSAGVPAVELLRAAGSLARHRARVEGRMRAARLSTRLLLPLGVCTLPAFLLLGVAPMLLSVMSTMPLSF